MCLHRLPHLSSLDPKLELKLDVEVEVEAGGVDGAETGTRSVCVVDYYPQEMVL